MARVEQDEDEQARQEQAEVRNMQRGFAERLERNPEDLQQINNNQEFDALQRGLTSGDYFNKVTNTSSATKDAELVRQTTAFLAQQVKNVGLSNARVTSALMAKELKLASTLSSSSQHHPVMGGIDYAQLGRDCRVFFPPVPSWDCMLGPVNVAPPAKKQRQTASASAAGALPAATEALAAQHGLTMPKLIADMQENPSKYQQEAAKKAKRTTPNDYKLETLGELKQSKRKAGGGGGGGSDDDGGGEDDDDDEESREKAEANQFKHHETLQNELSKTIKLHPKSNLFATVVNPQSFTQSVENIFALTFLVKDAKAALNVDNSASSSASGGFPTVQPEKGKLHATVNKLAEKTFVMTFSVDDWQRANELTSNGEFLLPNRTDALYEDTRNSSTTTTNGSSSSSSAD